MPPNKQFLSYFPASAAKKDDLYRLERLVEMRKGSQSSINKSDIIRAAFSFYFAAQPEADAINAELEDMAKQTSDLGKTMDKAFALANHAP